MKTRLTKRRKDLMVRIPNRVVKAAALRCGDRLEIAAVGINAISLTKAKLVPTLDELLAAITPENLHVETDWGTIGPHERC